MITSKHTELEHKHSDHEHDGHSHEDNHPHINHGDAHDEHGDHDHGEHGEHGRHDEHVDHGHGGHDEHGDHGHGGHGGGHGHGGHGGHGDHGGHGGHGGHGDHGGHGGHGDHGGGSKVLGIIGVGAVLGLIVLLGIPTLFSQIDHILGKQTDLADNPGDGLLSSYTVANAQDLYAAQVISVAQQMIDTPRSSMPVIYVTLSNGTRLMAMDMSAFKTQGISSAAIFMSKEAYQRAKNIKPGKVNLKITGEPPISLILAGMSPLIIGVELR